MCDLLQGGIDVFNAIVAGVFKICVEVAVFFDESDGSLEVADLGGGGDPIEVDGLYLDVLEGDRHSIN